MDIVDPAAWNESVRLYAEARRLWNAGQQVDAQAVQDAATAAWMRSLGITESTPRAAITSPGERAVPAGSGEIYAGRAAAVGERGVASTAALIEGEPA